ncbi:MAG: hypothetical protein ACT4QA_19370 [Panacagrimonas sp.]
MNSDAIATPTTDPAVAVTPHDLRSPVVLPRTRKQIQTAAMAEQSEVRTRWKNMLPDARTTWPKVPAEELVLVKGNVHKLAGMIQLRYRISREEADLQVKTFMARTP